MGLTVYGGGGKPEEEKTVTAGTSVIEVNPSSGKAMKKVTVNPTPTESKSVTPTTSELTVTPSEGKHLLQVVVGAVEDVTPEVTAQTPVITQIAENLGVTITTPSGTNKQILQGNNTNLLNIKNNAKKEGAYVWKKLTAQGGDFIDFVVSNSETAYPDSAVHTDGYWYELYGKPFKIVTWASGTDEEIVAMVEAADRGVIKLSDYWAVGDVRTVQLSAMDAIDADESHAAQEVDLVLMHAGGYDFNEAVASGRIKCSFIVGLKDSLAEPGTVYPGFQSTTAWHSHRRRSWCNNAFKNAIPNSLLPIFKQFKTISAQSYSSTVNQISVDYFALPAEREIFDARTNSNQTEYDALFQFDYYKIVSNRVKKLGKVGTADSWWERSPKNGSQNCHVNKDGSASYNGVGANYGLSPFGCI